MNTKHVFGYLATGLVALGVGSAIGSSAGAAPTATGETPTHTITATSTTTATATSTKDVPGPTVTVKATKPAKTVTVKVTPTPEAVMPGDGTFEVGVDVKPGTYVSGPPDSGNCYWARLSGSDSVGGIIANNNSSGQSLVTIAPSDKFFESNGCNDWHRR